MQLTIMKITGYGPWTLTLGSDREHELQILQASLYQKIQKLFSNYILKLYITTLHEYYINLLRAPSANFPE